MTKYLKRNEAANYLNGVGVTASKSSLARMAMLGDGPEYVVIRQRAYYKPEWLDNWLDNRFPSPSAIAHLCQNGGSDE